MPELSLTRSRADRKVYELDGAGTLRFGGWFSRSAEATTATATYTCGRRGLFSPTFEASDATGRVVGTYHGRAIRRGGELEWSGKAYRLRLAATFRERYALTEAGSETELATIEGRSWGKRPVTVSLRDPGAIDPGLLLFTAFVVRALAEDSSSSAGATTAATSAAT